MAAGKYNMLVQAGVTYNQTISLKNEAGVAVDLTGTSVASMIREQYTDTSPLATFSCEVLNPPTLGKFNIALTPGQTSELGLVASGRGVYDIELTYASGVKDRILQGNVVISKEVTR